MKHFLSESRIWMSFSEFIDSKGNTSYSEGESIIEIKSDSISNSSWVKSQDKIIENNYTIIQVNERHYEYQSVNPSLGIQKGTFDVDRNRLFSRFHIEGSRLNGYEIITRNEDICHAYGALYDEDALINTWSATLK